MNLLESLKRFTTVVADTGDIEPIAEYRPQDATTNPSLLFQAAQKPQYAALVDDALHHAIHFPGGRAERTEALMDRLLVNFGCEPVPFSQGGGLFVTDNGNHILDCRIDPIPDAPRLEMDIRGIPGVVGTGLFLGMADVVLVGDRDNFGLIEERRQGSR